MQGDRQEGPVAIQAQVHPAVHIAGPDGGGKVIQCNGGPGCAQRKPCRPRAVQRHPVLARRRQVGDLGTLRPQLQIDLRFCEWPLEITLGGQRVAGIVRAQFDRKRLVCDQRGNRTDDPLDRQFASVDGPGKRQCHRASGVDGLQPERIEHDRRGLSGRGGPPTDPQVLDGQSLDGGWHE